MAPPRWWAELPKKVLLTTPSVPKLIMAPPAFAVSVLNPNSVQLLVYPFFTLFSHAMQTYIVEWHSPDFHDVRFMPFALLWLLLLASLALSARRPTLTEVLLTIGLGYESLVSIRNIPLFAIVAAPLITRQWACVLRPMMEPQMRPQRRVLSAVPADRLPGPPGHERRPGRGHRGRVGLRLEFVMHAAAYCFRSAWPPNSSVVARGRSTGRLPTAARRASIASGAGGRAKTSRQE